ncbi:MAG: hypothetical protein P4K78_00790 [Terracidiphilus sp.]|nr:hypothetical protein [Terracidiphilus sp.]
MRLFGWILALVSIAGPLALAAPNAFSQSSAFGVNLVSVPESATYQPAEEAVEVQATLNQFDSALDAHDVGRLRAAGIKAVTAKRWQSFFRDNPRATVTDRCPVSELFISDSTASWTCSETITVISEGKPRAFVYVIRFKFAKTNGAWMIEDRR